MRPQPRRWVKSVALLLLAVAPLFGCGAISDDDGMSAHDCPTGKNSDWTNLGTLTLTHTFPQYCPIEKPSTITGGGTITETTASHPYDGDAETMNIAACQFYYTSTYACSGFLDDDSDDFGYILVSGSYKWRAQASLQWTPGPTPDYVEFEVVCGVFASCADDTPTAWVELDWDEPE